MHSDHTLPRGNNYFEQAAAIPRHHGKTDAMMREILAHAGPNAEVVLDESCPRGVVMVTGNIIKAHPGSWNANAWAAVSL